MKTAMALTLTLFASLSAGAATEPVKFQRLECRANADENARYQGSFHAILDDSQYSPGSGFFALKNATVGYQFAASQLHCSAGFPKNRVGCLGYWFGVPGQIAELVLEKNSQGTITAKVYVTPYEKQLEMACLIKDAE